MSQLLSIGHRGRSPQTSQDQIPALQAGILKAQQFGKDWYVNSASLATSNSGDGSTPDSAKTTLAAALALTSSGDRIFIAAGHAETIEPTHPQRTP